MEKNKVTIESEFSFICLIVGLSGGIIVGSSIAALITLLQLVPRIAHFNSIENYIKIYETAIKTGSVSSEVIYLLNITLRFSHITADFTGLFSVVFIGIIAGALAETLDVIPEFVHRINLIYYICFLIISISLGKVVGSLIYWILPVIFK